MIEQSNGEDILICDNCGRQISVEYIKKSPKVKSAAIKLCEECAKQRSKIYAKVWHQKHLKEHRETNKLYQRQYRADGRNTESLNKFWNKPENKNKRTQYIQNYLERKTKELGITKKELQKLSVAKLVKGATKENVQERLRAISKNK